MRTNVSESCVESTRHHLFFQTRGRIAGGRAYQYALALLATVAIVVAWLVSDWPLAYVASFVYAAALLCIFVVSPGWRLAAFLVLFVSGPPYLEYELAWVAITGIRMRPELGLRSQLTSIVFSVYDLLLLIAAAHFTYVSAKKGRVPRSSVSLLYCTSFLIVLGGLSSLNAALVTPGNELAAVSGFMQVLRPALTVLCVLGSRSNVLFTDEDATGLLIGALLFLGESVVVTVVKYGALKLGSAQLSGLLPGAGATGSFLVLLAPALIGIGLHSKCRRRGKYFLGVGVLGALYAVLTLSRASLVGLVVALAVMAIVSPSKETARVLVLVGMIAAIAAVLVGGQVSDYFVGKFRAMFVDSPLDYYNLQARVRIWSTGLEYLRRNWMLGIGPNMWGVLAVGSGHHLHNGYLQLAVESGLIAALVLVVVLLRACVGLWRYARTYRDRPERGANLGLAVGMLSGMCGYMVTQLFENSIGSYRVTAVLWLAITYASILSAAGRKANDGSGQVAYHGSYVSQASEAGARELV